MSNLKPSTAQATQNFSKSGSARRVPVETQNLGSADTAHNLSTSEAAFAPENGSLGTSSSDLESNLSASAAKWIGRPLKQYVVEKRLGGGGMGEVFLARHSWLDLPVAIKILNPVLGSDPEAIERFRREAQLAADLNHPNIVRATDGGPIEDSYFLVTEYLDGMDLSDLVVEHGSLSPGYACWIVCQVAKALEHAHACGLVHRDIKPSNIMLLRDGSVKLLDLGLARYANSKAQMTATGQFMGTIDYVSPEQAIDTRNVDHRADIYSLGCTLYFLIAGQAPFDGVAYDSLVSKILAHAEEVPVSIDTVRANVSPIISETIAQMVEKQPEDRLQSAHDIIAALGGVASKEAHLRFFDGTAAEEGAKEFKPDSTQSESVPVIAAKVKRDRFEEFSQGFFAAIKMVIAFCFEMIGFIERYEVPSTKRRGKPITKFRLKPTTIGMAVGGFGFLYFFFTRIFIIQW